MSRQHCQLDALKERQVNLAIEALKQDPKLSQRRAAVWQLHRVSEWWLRRGMDMGEMEGRCN
jgi:hypothetical protein